VGHDQVDGGGGGEQEAGERDGGHGADELGGHEGGRRAGGDAGEGVGQGAAGGDGGVGEAGGGGEPVGGGDVAGHGVGGRRGPPGADDTQDHEHQPEGGHDLAQPQAGRGALVGRQGDRGEVEHRVGHHRPHARPDQLGGDVRQGFAGREAPVDTVGQRHDWVEVGAGYRPEGQDQGHEAGGGGRGVLQQLEAHVPRG
jgi:hypothetical protein